MVRQGTGFIKSTNLIILIIFLLMGCPLLVFPKQVEAEGNEPTNTPMPTATETPTITLMPSDTPVPEDSSLEAKSITQPDISFDNNAAPLSTGDEDSQPGSLTDTLGRTNLCLIGVIVLGTIVVIVMVVFGVIQRVRAEG